LLQGNHGRIEALDVADHQAHAGLLRCGDDRLSFFHAEGDRLFDQHVRPAPDHLAGDLAMHRRRHGNRHGVRLLLVQHRRSRHRLARQTVSTASAVGPAHGQPRFHVGHVGISLRGCGPSPANHGLIMVIRSCAG
jgi:hypothetical protein